MPEDQWRKIDDTTDWVDARTMALTSPSKGMSFILTQYLDWEGNVVSQEGEEALAPLIEFSLKVQAIDPDDFDPDIIKEKAAPMIAKIIGELMEEEIDPDSIVESMELSMDGTWTANAAPMKLRPPPKLASLN